MGAAGSSEKRTSFGGLAVAFCAGILLSVAALGASARGPSAEADGWVYPEKGLYWGGYAYTFRAETYWVSPYHDLKLEQLSDNDGFAVDWTMSLTAAPVQGDLGVCVFNNLLYCFFTTSDGNLQYLTVNVPTRQVTGPTTIVKGVSANGAAAAVLGGSIYAMVAPGSGFKSGDGKNFTAWTPKFSHSPPSQMIAAAPFYPLGDDPASILWVYNDSSSAKNLSSCIVLPSDLAEVAQETALPWPSANPTAWKPLVDGHLLVGTAGSPAPGAKAPCVQLYGVTDYGDDGQHQGRWEYDLATRGWTFHDITQQNLVLYMGAFPWFTTEDSRGTMRSNHVLEMHGNSSQFLSIPSDWMVPQNDSAGYGWAGTPTPTSGAAGTDLQNLWTLVGVVLGPPPYPMNGQTDACYNAIPYAWVDYGKNTSTTVSTTSTSSSTITVASGSEVKGGLGDWSLDLSYAHAWTSSHGTSKTVSVSQDFQFYPCSEPTGSQGTHGWAIFNAPTLVTQWYKLYAYDYDLAQNTGSYLDQDIYATSLGEVVQETASFDLADPSRGSYPGLFSGMPTYPNSTDIPGWHSQIPGWDGGGANWTVIFGDTTNPQMPALSLGSNNEVTYTQSDTTLSSKGNSNSFGVQAGDQFDIFGFSESLTAGYDGEWTAETENESTITQNVTCGLNVPIPGDDSPPGTIISMSVQPFWLQAKTAKAPWLPTAYGSNFPWCIAWEVAQFATASGATAGLAGPPASASGKIRHGGDKPKDTYSIEGARLAWLSSSGIETPIPLTAEQFDPARGARVILNGHAFATEAKKGKWSRKGDLWKYKTKEGVTKDPFTLVLDFAGGTWAFDGASKDLDQVIKTAEGEMRVDLEIQSQYHFSHRLGHDVEARWSHTEKKAGWQPYGAHETDGEYASRTSSGALTLKGHIPKKVEEFGDFEVRINDERVFIPLLSQEGFLDDLQRGRAVKYAAEGFSFEIDLGAGQWKMVLEGAAFNSGMAPKQGEIRVRLYVGGAPLSDQILEIQKHTTELKFGG